MKRNLAPSGPQSPATTSYGYDDGNSVPLPRPDIPLANLNRKRATLTQRNVVISNPPRTTTTKRTLVSKSPRPPATATSTTTTTSTATTTTSTTTTRLTTPSTTTTTPAPPTTTPTSTTPTTTTSRTSTICAPRYTGGQYTITGTGTLPKPTAFVKRNGRQLQVNGQAYRPVGPNIYWLGLDEVSLEAKRSTASDATLKKGYFRDASVHSLEKDALTSYDAPPRRYAPHAFFLHRTSASLTHPSRESERQWR